MRLSAPISPPPAVSRGNVGDRPYSPRGRLRSSGVKAEPNTHRHRPIASDAGSPPPTRGHGTGATNTSEDGGVTAGELASLDPSNRHSRRATDIGDGYADDIWPGVPGTASCEMFSSSSGIGYELLRNVSLVRMENNMGTVVLILVMALPPTIALQWLESRNTSKYGVR